MNKQDLQLLNIEVGTFKRADNQLTLDMERKLFRYDRISELNELKHDDPDFLQLTNLIEEDHHVVLTYLLPDKVKSLKELPKEDKAIRTSIAKEIMNQAIISKSSYHVNLNPSNIWYYPMHHVWYAYRANELMPFDDKHSDLEKYRALMLFCLTGATYERLLDEPRTVINKKHPDELLTQVIGAKSVSELAEIINGIEDFVNYQEWQQVDQIKASHKRKYIYTTVGIALVALLMVGLVKKNDQKKYQALVSQSQTKIVQLKAKNQLQKYIDNKDWKTARTAMTKAGYSKQRQVQTLLKYKQYQVALNVDPSQLNKIVNLAYKNNQKDNILTWVLPSKAKGSIQSQLKLEKAIINYDTNKMGNEVSFTDNPDVLLRMGEAYLDHDDTQNAQNVQTKLSGLSINKAKYLKALIKHKSASKSVDNAKKKLEDAEKADDKDKDNKIKSAKADIKTAKKSLDTAQKEVEKWQKKVGE